MTARSEVRLHRVSQHGLIRLLWFSLFALLLGPAGLRAQVVSPDLLQFTTIVIPTGGDPDAIAVADVNHDGWLDVIAANPNSGTVSVLLGDGKGKFHPAAGSPFPAGHLPSDIGIGDFNGDGHSDLLIPNHQTPNVTLLLGDGKGGFRPALHSPFATNSVPHPHGVALGYFCGKGQPLDAAIDSWGSGQIELLIGDGKGNLRNGPMFAVGPGTDMPLRSTDFNSDKIPDIVMPDTAIGRWNSNEVSVLLGDGKCGFHPAPGSPFPGGAAPWSIAVGDLKNDGNAGFVVVPYGPQVPDPRQIAATVVAGDGKGGFSPVPGSPFPLPGCASPRRVAIGNLTGNGRGDIVFTCMNRSTVLLFLVEKAGGYRTVSLNVSSGRPGEVPAERGVALADLTGRGRDDVIISNGSAGTVTLLIPK